MRARALRCVLIEATLLAVSVAAAPAQTAQSGVPNAMQGFSQNRNEPVKIDSRTLEVRDKEQTATFLGDVHLVQGDTVLTCKTLVVYYEGRSPSGPITVSRPGSKSQHIRRMEAKGSVVVIQKDQTASGSIGTFDMQSNTVTLNGNVVVTQGPNVMRGERLVVDLSTGVSRMEGGRVQGLFLPRSQHETQGAGIDDKEPPKAPASMPMRLN
jgi:lipopolysaccharide export system protein LptA